MKIRDQWCKSCEASTEQEDDLPCPECGEEVTPAEYLDLKSDYEIYDEENPR